MWPKAAHPSGFLFIQKIYGSLVRTLTGLQFLISVCSAKFKPQEGVFEFYL